MNDRRPRILAIDDTPANLLTLAAALSREFDVQIATSGAMGLKLAAEALPDLILLDVMMPEMDGYETCRRLQSEPSTRDIPVIFVTALSSAQDETLGLEVGAVDFISKPVNPAVVRARVNTHLTLKYQADLLRQLAFIDGLTAVANRRQFDETLEIEWRACRRSQSFLALVMIDIDQFKQFNDTYGHQVGDVCLKAVAGVLKAGMGRSHDLVARYGGEEFVCLLPGTDLAGTQVMVEELRQGVLALLIPHATATAAQVVTISLGAATTVPNEALSPDRLISAADAQLYEAKLAGRNCSRCVEICADGTISIRHGEARATTSGTPLPDVPGFDIATALSRIDGNALQYRNFLRLFRERNAEDICGIQVAMRSGDVKTARLLAHALEGSASSVGAVKLQAAAAQLEASLKESVIDAEALGVLEAEWQQAVASLVVLLDTLEKIEP